MPARRNCPSAEIAMALPACELCQTMLGGFCAHTKPMNTAADKTTTNTTLCAPLDTLSAILPPRKVFRATKRPNVKEEAQTKRGTEKAAFPVSSPKRYAYALAGAHARAHRQERPPVGASQFE